jgi:hypothetical protein
MITLVYNRTHLAHYTISTPFLRSLAHKGARLVIKVERCEIS